MTGTVLITGAAGFSGHALAEQYAARGWRVAGTVRGKAQLPGSNGALEFHAVDLEDGAAVVRLVQHVRPDIVHHLAAQSSVAASWRDPFRTLQINAGMQLNLLEALRTLPYAPRILVVGSCDEYGRVGGVPVTEDAPLLPVTPYAVSKVTQDLMGYQYFAAYGLPVVRVRPFLQIGPRRADRFVAGALARQVAEIAAGRRAPVVTAGNLDLARDFTDVRDVACAMALAVEEGQPGAVYNIASGRAHSLHDLLAAMLRSAGIEAEVRVDPALLRPGEMPLLVGDASHLREGTGWQPQITFEQSAADTLAWWQERIGDRQTAGEEVR